MVSERCALVLLIVVLVEAQNDPASRQIVDFKRRTKGPIGVMTTAGGAPVEVQDTKVLNKPLVLNEYYMDTITHLVRERIPERVVHAKGGGAFGYFEVTHDIKHICKAKLFSHVGKKTPVAARFSPVVIERGGTDTTRDVRGFAVKFFTEEGNFDIVGFNTPIFVVKDPVYFPAFVRAQKRNPATGLYDNNMLWDFLTLRPESLYLFMMVFSDRGVPDGYRYMPGYAIHTYEVANDKGEKHYVRFHFHPDAGIRNLRENSTTDPDYAIRDLYNAIANRNFPSWSVKIQVLTPEDVKTAGFDVFDVTKVLPLDRYPLKPLGKLLLNKNPLNYFAEIEQLAFSPANLVPGILGAPDKVFEARRMAYRDSQYYRLGANFYNIPVNCPLLAASNPYNRDGRPPVLDNGKNTPNYYPNSFNGAMPYKDERSAELIQILQDEPNNFAQARELYVNGMSEDERGRLVQNILNSVSGVTEEIQARVIALFTAVHPELGSNLQQGLSSVSGSRKAKSGNSFKITTRFGGELNESEEDCDHSEY